MINRSLLISIFTLSTSLFGMQVLEISPQHVMKSHQLGDVSLGLSRDCDFYVKQHNKIHKVQKAFVDKELRNVSPEKLQKFLGKGYLSLQKLSNDEYTVKAKVRGLGGGPTLAFVTYWSVKIGAYVGIVVGTTVAVGAAAGTLPVAGTAVGITGGLASAGMAVAAPSGAAASIIMGGAGASSTLVGSALAGGLQASANIAATAATVEAVASSAALTALSLPTW